MHVLFTCIACAIVCAILTYIVRRHAIVRQILDHPNERSSHTTATPRGGGLAIAIATLSATFLNAIFGFVDIPLATAIVGGGGAIALIGWLDDLGKVRVPIRLSVQLLAATGAVMVLKGMPHVVFGMTTIGMGFAGSVLAILGIVWCTNLYNFMDGIDGLAASEAVCVTGIGAVVTILSGQSGVGIVLAAMTGSAIAFLFWNWQPARIFMGDVGSGLIGFIIGVCAVATQRSHTVSITVWLVLLLVFLADATITLLRRMYAREPLHIAHRTHAYQRAVQAGWSHQRVTIAILVINTVLATLAIGIWKQPGLTMALTITAVAVVGIAYLVVEQARPMYTTSVRSRL